MMQRFVGQGEVTETGGVRLLERQFRTQLEVQARERGFQPVGIGEGILDGQAHVRHSQLCFHGTVLKLYHGVDDGLRVYHDFYLVGTYTEQPFGFDYLEPFVHHGSRVYRDFGAHVPVGVFQCLRFGDGC